MSTKRNFLKVAYFITGIILLFQVVKRDQELSRLNNRMSQIIATNSPFAKLIDQRSIYRDSSYSIYAAVISNKNRLIFLSIDTLTNQQRESKFFVHVYPKDSNYLPPDLKHVPFNFSGDFESFDFNGESYYVTSMELPNFEIEKLNVGQYGYRGNPEINWKIKELLTGDFIAKILKENHEDMNVFEYRQESF